MNSDKLILVVCTMSDVLYIYDFQDGYDEFIIMSDCSFFIGLDLYLFTRYYWYKSVRRVRGLNSVVNYSTIHVVVELSVLFSYCVLMVVYI